ncbi:VQ domain-containing protein, partial [Cephalotus follicularis]
QIQGPRPSPLSVHKDSQKIKKPPLPLDRRQPLIIYAVSPKVVQANADNFMSVVQRLTGLTSSDFSAYGDVSPAARLASTEKTSPSAERGNLVDLIDLADGLDFSQLPGILSPAPEKLPSVPASYFSPASDPSWLSLLHDLSPFLHGNGSGLMTSPSALLSMPPIASPDMFGQF